MSLTFSATAWLSFHSHSDTWFFSWRNLQTSRQEMCRFLFFSFFFFSLDNLRRKYSNSIPFSKTSHFRWSFSYCVWCFPFCLLRRRGGGASSVWRLHIFPHFLKTQFVFISFWNRCNLVETYSKTRHGLGGLADTMKNCTSDDCLSVVFAKALKVKLQHQRSRIALNRARGFSFWPILTFHFSCWFYSDHQRLYSEGYQYNCSTFLHTLWSKVSTSVQMTLFSYATPDLEDLLLLTHKSFLHSLPKVLTNLTGCWTEFVGIPTTIEEFLHVLRT